MGSETGEFQRVYPEKFDFHPSEQTGRPKKTGVYLQYIGQNYCGKSSYFLGDPPPDPRFVASLGTLSLVYVLICEGVT
jgi:hypothetical protein